MDGQERPTSSGARTRPSLAHVHYCPLCDETRRDRCGCRTPENGVQLCRDCLAYLFSRKDAA